MDSPAMVERGEGRVESSSEPIGPRQMGPRRRHGVLLWETVDRRDGRERGRVGWRRRGGWSSPRWETTCSRAMASQGWRSVACCPRPEASRPQRHLEV